MGVVLELPVELREELKEPLGPVYRDADALLAEAGRPLVAVGDIVTYHLLEAGRRPEVALIDGKTKREAVEREVLEAVSGFDREREVSNPPATLTVELLGTLSEAIDAEGTTVIVVDGEEDLAALPAVLAAPAGGSVVYGQPDEGMVLAAVDEDARARVRRLVDRMTGDHDRARTALGVSPPADGG